MDEPEFDQQLLEFLEVHGYAERQALLKHFQDIAKDQVGGSESAFKRRIRSLEQRGMVHTLTDKELDAYGITKKDLRVSYLVSSSASKLKAHLDHVVTLLGEKNPHIQSLALLELDMHRYNYRLSHKQLDKLIDVLSAKDATNTETAARILEYYAQRDRLPFSKDKFRTILKQKLQEISPSVDPKTPRKHTNMLDNLLLLLGKLHDEVIIDEMKKDAATPIDYTELRRIYSFEGVANVIDDHITELFDYQLKLQANGKVEEAHRIQQIRSIAKDKVREINANKKHMREGLLSVNNIKLKEGNRQ
jgi:hypothetical protein